MHGQMYVLLSRCTRRENVRLVIGDDEDGVDVDPEHYRQDRAGRVRATRNCENFKNVVYPELMALDPLGDFFYNGDPLLYSEFRTRQREMSV